MLSSDGLCLTHLLPYVVYIYVCVLWDGALAIFSENRVLTFVVILRNKTGGSFLIGPTFVGSF